MSNLHLFNAEIGTQGVKRDLRGIAKPVYQTIGPTSQGWAEMMSACRGTHLKNVSLGLTFVPSFQDMDYIPVIPHGSSQLGAGLAGEIVCAGLKETLHPKTGQVRNNIRQHIGVPDNAKLIILPHGDDDVLELHWQNSVAIATALQKQNIYAYIPPNFSQWDNQPLRERDLNIKRSFVVGETMDAHGIPVVPHLYWKRNCPEDLERLATLINRTPSLHTVASNFQTFEEPSLWQKMVADLARLVLLLHRPVHFLIIGPTEPPRIQKIVEATMGRVTIINSAVAMNTWSRRRLVATPYKLVQQYVGNQKNQQQTEMFADKPLVPVISLPELYEDNKITVTQVISQHKSASGTKTGTINFQVGSREVTGRICNLARSVTVE